MKRKTDDMTNIEIIRELEGLRESMVFRAFSSRQNVSRIKRRNKKGDEDFSQGLYSGIRLSERCAAKELKQLIRKIKKQTV